MIANEPRHAKFVVKSLGLSKGRNPERAGRPRSGNAGEDLLHEITRAISSTCHHLPKALMIIRVAYGHSHDAHTDIQFVFFFEQTLCMNINYFSVTLHYYIDVMMIDVRGLRNRDTSIGSDLMQAPRCSDEMIHSDRHSDVLISSSELGTGPAGWMLIRSLTHVVRLCETCEIRAATRKEIARDGAANPRTKSGGNVRCIKICWCGIFPPPLFWGPTNWNCVRSPDANRAQKKVH